MQLLLQLVILLVCAKLAGEAFERIKQPPVLGELFVGILLGKTLFDVLQPGEIISFLAEIGLILLLFEVGLESDLFDLVKVGKTSFLVALMGVVLPFILGYGLSFALGFDNLTSLFMGSALTATSVGISARVLFDLGRLHTKEGKIILGAAVFDDILGLLFFSIVASIASEGAVSYPGIARITITSVLFLAATVVVGIKASPILLKIVTGMCVRGVFVVSGFIFAILLAYVADALGLATIIGAFAAGLVLPSTEEKFRLTELIKPVADIFVPIFFVVIGIAVDIKVLLKTDVILVALVFCAVAIMGKTFSGFAARGANKLIVGIGMIPRGEVGLIFAAFGVRFALIDDLLYSSLLFIVVVTTAMTPVLLRMMFR